MVEIQPFNCIENAWKLKELMSDDQLLLVYADHFNSKSYEYLMWLAENRLKQNNTDIQNRKKITNIVIEAVQNISKHGYSDRDDSVAALLIVGKHNENSAEGKKGRYFVLTGNTITKQKKEYLFDRLGYLNSLTPDELREYYKQTMLYHMMTDNQSAGLGFLDMMRKAQNKLLYHFTPLDKEHYFFTFKVTVRESAVA